VFEQAKGLHDEAAGLSVVVGGKGTDPLVMFEEHGTDQVCQYFVEQRNGILAPGLQPKIHSPELRELVGDEDTRRNWFAIRGIFGQEDPAYVNTIVEQLRKESSNGGLASFVEVARRLQRRTTVVRMLASAQAQPARPLSEIAGSPHPLDHHAGGAHVFVSYLYEPLLLMGSPFSRGFV
jgi:hypothetical protein